MATKRKAKKTSRKPDVWAGKDYLDVKFEELKFTKPVQLDLDPDDELDLFPVGPRERFALEVLRKLNPGRGGSKLG